MCAPSVAVVPTCMAGDGGSIVNQHPYPLEVEGNTIHMEIPICHVGLQLGSRPP